MSIRRALVVMWLGFFMAAGSAAAVDIWLPRQHCPAFVTPGGNFAAEVRGAAGLSASGWSASMQNELRTWNGNVTSATYGSIHQGLENGWKLTITVPTNTPPELFELLISHSSGEATNAVRAVSVVRDFEQSFYILQLTDQHIDNGPAVKANGSSSLTWETGSTASMAWASSVINLINPRLVMCTGDNLHLYFGATSWCGLDEARRRIRIYLDALKLYSVPTCLVDGNHDIGYSSYTNSRLWRDTYEMDIGQRVWSFRMGSFYVLGQEFSYDEFLPWAKSDYAASWTGASVKYRLIAQHYPDAWVDVTTAATPCNLMIVGHNHSTATLSTSPYPVLSSGTSQDYQKSSFFSFERDGSGWSCPQVTNHVADVSVFRLFGDWGSPGKVRITYTHTNDGQSSSNSASVINDLPQDFYNGRVKFLMTHGTYVATGGEIEAQYDYNSSSNTAVLVKVSILKNATTPVSIVREATSNTPVVGGQMTWKNVAIGGGGYVTGIAIHPTEADLIYIRTDVGGAYRWNFVDSRWVPLLDWVDPDQKNLGGVDGLALDRNNPDVVYLALGQSISSSVSGVYKSSDRGQTWRKVLSARFDSNSSGLRWCGECLAVDPNNSSVVYCGTRIDGLWRSENGGGTWAKVSDVPVGYTNSTPTGVRCIVMDGASAIGGKSSIVYAAIPGTGIYWSTNAGVSFAAMPGAPVDPRRMEVAGAGSLVVTHATGVSLSVQGVWTSITPSAESGAEFCAVSVETANSSKIVVARYADAFNNTIYRSTDKGGSWQKLGATGALIVKHPDVPWWPLQFFSSANACMAFDPHHAGKLFFTDWFGVWNTPDVWASITDWYTTEKGHEETCTIQLACPPAGAPLFSCFADVCGFRHASLDEFPANRLTTKSEGVGIDFCAAHPESLVLLDATSWAGDNTRLLTSGDGGVTWTVRTVPAGTKLGKIACSATDTNRIVYCPGDRVPYFTVNGGDSWTASIGAPSGAVVADNIWNRDGALAADGVDGLRFYLYKAGQMYVSDDGGANWSVRNGGSTLPAKSGWLMWTAAAPGLAGEVWISLGGNGLWRSGDAGTNFSRIGWFAKSQLLTWGKAAPEQSHPTAYVYGTHDGQWGLYRSTDLGTSWTNISGTCQFGGGADVIAGDRQVFGRVYVGTGGRGIIYGELGSEPVAPTAAAFPAYLVPVIDGTVDIEWQQATSYDIATPILGSVDSPADLSGTFRVMWDCRNLYLLVDVQDDTRRNDSGSTVYDDDTVEVYVDGDDSKGATYDADDYQYLFRWNDNTVYETQHSATHDVRFATVNTAGGYRMEIALPWSTLGVSPQAEHFIGLDVQINDDDDGETRDGKKAWHATDDTAWRDPRQFGQARLVNGDLDGDSLPDAWEQLYFGGTNAAHGAANEDYDGDGFLNRRECLAGTSPADPASALEFVRLDRRDGNRFVVQWQSAAGRFYSIDRTTNLLVSWVGHTNHLEATPPINVYTDMVSPTAQAFYRVRAE